MNNLLYKSVDCMKLSKDNCNSPFSDADMTKVVANLKALGLTHIGISVPMDYPAYALKWATSIHTGGLKVLHRPTWNAIEGLYGFAKMVGINRPTDANNYWISRTKSYIVDNPGIFADGDLWAPLPERTEGIFQYSTSFLPEPLPDNYATFFNSLVDASVSGFTQIGKTVKTGMTANNFTEVDSGWIPQSLFDKAGITVVDHYGSTHLPSEMDADLRRIYTKHGKKIFLQEWGNYWNNGDINDAKAMFEVLKQLSTDGILVGFNYWGAWAGTPEGILNADLSVNAKGQLLGTYFGTATPTPTPTPVPTPTPTPTTGVVTLGPKGTVYSTYAYYDILKDGTKLGRIRVYN